MSYKQLTPRLSNFVILHYQKISPEVIQLIQEKSYCTCEIHQSDSQTIYKSD